MSNIDIFFRHPLVLILLIPAVVIAMIPVFRMPKAVRFTKNRIASLVIHLALIIMAVLILSGLRVYKASEDSSILLLVDMSDSTDEKIEGINDYIEELTAGVDGDTKVGIVTFGGDSVCSSDLDSEASGAFDSYIDAKSIPDSSATNIADAMYYAADLFDDGDNKRIILLSDGKETDGDALKAAETLAKSDIRVDTVYFDTNEENLSEVQLNNLVLPENVDASDTIDIAVNAQSSIDTTGTLQIFDNDELVSEESVTINAGKNQYSTEYKVEGAGIHSFSAVLSADTDTLEENNTVYSCVNASGAGNILIIDGTGTDSAELAALIENDYNLTVVNASESDAYTSGLKLFDEVILCNVSTTDLSDSFQTALETYVDKYGGGLLTTGGHNTYIYGSMSGTIFDDLLPVKVIQDDTKSVAMMLVIDSSSSMAGDNIVMAREGACNSVNALSVTDFAGVIDFATYANLVAELTPMTERQKVLDAINGIETTHGTYLFDAVYMAYEELKDFDADIKHVIILSDGNPSDYGYDNVIQLMSDAGITTSTIAFGEYANGDIMEYLAELGEGRYYNVQTPQDLPDIMFDEAVASKGEYWNELNFTPEIRTYTSEINGIETVPEIGGYISSSIKEDATSVLVTEDNMPVYSKWDYGTGKVGSLMCDVNGVWSDKLLSTEEGQTFLKNMVASLITGVNSNSALFVNVAQNNYEADIQINAELDDSDTLTAEVISPSGKKTVVTAENISDGLYEAVADTQESGLYTINVSQYNDAEELVDYNTVYTNVSYSLEYDCFKDFEGESKLDSISQLTKGELLYSVDDLLNVSQDFIYHEFNPVNGFLIIALTLFLIDIFIRKFNFLKVYHRLVDWVKRR